MRERIWQEHWDQVEWLIVMLKVVRWRLRGPNKRVGVKLYWCWIEPNQVFISVAIEKQVSDSGVNVLKTEWRWWIGRVSSMETSVAGRTLMRDIS